MTSISYCYVKRFPSFLRKHPPKKKQLKIPLSVFFFHPLFFDEHKRGQFLSALLCWSNVCFFLRFPLRIVGCRENRRILGWIHGGFGKTAGNIPQMMVSLVREVFPLKIPEKIQPLMGMAWEYGKLTIRGTQ